MSNVSQRPDMVIAGTTDCTTDYQVKQKPEITKEEITSSNKNAYEAANCQYTMAENPLCLSSTSFNLILNSRH